MSHGKEIAAKLGIRYAQFDEKGNLSFDGLNTENMTPEQ
jgi:hypothetical protein